MSDACRTRMAQSNGGRLRSVLVLCLLVLAAPPSAIAASPEWSLRDYVHTTWTQTDGLPLGRLRQILQTSDGYLWLVTQDSRLLRFDGIRFVPIGLACDLRLAVSAGDGDLFLNCEDGRILRRTANGQQVALPTEPLPSGRIRGLFVDSRRRLWIYGWKTSDTGAGFVARLEPDGHLREFLSHLDRGPDDVAEAADGTIWFSNRATTIRVRDEQGEVLPGPEAWGVTADASGAVFAWNDETIWRLGDAAPAIVARATDGIRFANFPRGMAAAADRGLWMGTRRHGLALIQNGQVETLPDGTAGDFVNAVFIDREGTIWAAMSSGLHRFRQPRARIWSSLMDRLKTMPSFLLVDSQANVWSGATDRLVRTDADGSWQTFDGTYRAAGEDQTGRIWLARHSEIGYLQNGRFQPVHDDTGTSAAEVFAFTRDDAGVLWALATGTALYRVSPGPLRRVIDIPTAASDFVISGSGTWIGLRNGDVMQVIDGRDPIVHETEGLSGGSVMAIAEIGDAIWMAGYGGLLRWRHGIWTAWSRAQGLPGDGGVYEIATDRFDRLWLMTSGGIIVVPLAQLDATPDGVPGVLTFAQIGSLDRVFPHTGGIQPSPRVVTDASGRLYFATFDSIAVVDPETITESSLKPTIVLESVVADNQSVDLTTAPRLIEPSRLQFEYTSLSLRSPENIRFRYKLEGYDRDWIDSGGQRRVTYGTLKPGAYTFRVIGSGSEGVWNEEGASVAVQIAPVFWHTWWFWLSAAALTAVAIGGAYRRRVHTLTRQLHMRFEERLSERTRIARDLHDTLLQDALAAVLHVQLANDTLVKTSESELAITKALPLLKRAEQLLSHGVDQGRATVTGLRADAAPPDLAKTLRDVARQQREHQDIDCRITVKGTPRPLQPQVSDDVYFIAREALINAYQHSRARRIDVELVYTASYFRSVVRDDGGGIELAVLRHGREGHWGLTGMRERADRLGAELNLRTSATAGTEIELRLTNQLAFGDPAPVFWRSWATRFSTRPSPET